ncbi:MAG: ribonuclease Y [Acidobacteria bacterium]|nr:ribonuclease Y [Acidobacteriota bacterium]
MLTEILIAAAAALTVILAAWWFFFRHATERVAAQAQREADGILAAAQRESEAKLKEAELAAREKLLQARGEFEKASRRQRKELEQLEKRTQQKEDALRQKENAFQQKESAFQRASDELRQGEKSFAKRERKLEVREAALEEEHAELEELIAVQTGKLEQIAGLTARQAKDELVEAMKTDARMEAAHMVKRIDDEAHESADRDAQRIVGMAVQRAASDYVAETTVSVVMLPSDEMKGRIIGREGRNIRAIEAATGIDLIIDDTPEAVIVSGFDPFRREIARTALERLIKDGRIHPARIEEVVEKVKAEFEQKIRQEGESALLELNLPNVHQELVRLLGRLRYRTSYGQNVLQHSKEVSFLAGTMAAELKVNVQVAKRAGLLHDIGKAVDREMEGTHLEIGIDLLRKYGEGEDVIHAMACHHGDYDPETVEAILVTAADALSAARPGARREILETYIKRLEALEELASSFKGVQKSYAIQAGREIRVIVDSKKLSDDEAIWLSRDIAGKVESELTYPGQIKVTVIRETRSIEYAK